MQIDKKERISWYFYDFANSAFTTSVITVFLGPYLNAICRNAADASNNIHIFGIPIFAESLFGYVISLSVILQAILLPFLGAIADYTHAKKTLLAFFAYIGASATIGMYFLEGTNFMLGAILLLISNLSFGASIVMYNAFLNDIAEENERDNISSKGWALGFLGGGIVLLMNLILFSNASSFGISEGYAVRISITSAGVWWALFTILPMIYLKNRKSIRHIPQGQHYLLYGIKELINTVKATRKTPKTLRFMLAYVLYNDGVQAVITFAAVFGAEELKLEQSTLISAILLVQFVAIFGALGFNKIGEKLGSKNAILISLFVWIACVSYAYSALHSTTEFYALAAAIAIVLGGTQALSRSLFSKMIPSGKEAEYFSIYEISERGTSWLGTLIFSLSLQLTHSYRLAILSLVVFFALGILTLWKTDTKGAIDEGKTLKNI